MTRQTSDIGFANAAIVRGTVRRLKLRGAAKDARSAAEALRDLMRQHVEAVRGDFPAVLAHVQSLSRADLKNGIDIAALAQAERDALREDELLEGVELFLQLLDRIEVGIRHGLFSASCEQEPSEADQDAHRLCGGAK